ncbi:D-lactaldehyde dehydrogenase [Crucibulum laeve]|uniref:D-lactaldehyde dehydrogenase n=1 Tax=Crucibulum laeve TaxID=68775 RepID=A0A5C3LMF3_9AGAR|nr:D-lactaldehyde dehydrogenase [Crucibulum laeve]
MPTILPPSKVLVTGANGYVAMWVVRRLLERGYAVRGSVRSQEKGAYLQDYFKTYGNKFEIVIVEDITKEGAFDEAVKDIDAIEHVASPMESASGDPDEYVKPAVRGTLALTKSVLHDRSSVKRIVYTSSTGAITRPTDMPITLNEDDWNDAAVKEYEEKGKGTSRMAAYFTSKVLAERTAIDFVNKHKEELNCDLVTLNPPMVSAPPLNALTSPESLHGSVKWWYNFILAEGEKSEDALAGVNSWIDVRDLADAHVTSLEKEEAGGERIITSAGRVTWQEWIDSINSLNGLPPLSRPLPRGIPGVKGKFIYNFNLSKQKRILQLNFRSKEATARDLLELFSKQGW